MKLQCILSVVLFLLSIGCNQEKVADKRTYIGQYSINYPHGSETLCLDEDGSFTQIYIKAENGVATTNSGTWKLDSKYNEIFLQGAILFDTREGTRSEHWEKTGWGLSIVRRFDAISLRIDAEGAFEYEKARPSQGQPGNHQ